MRTIHLYYSEARRGYASYLDLARERSGGSAVAGANCSHRSSTQANFQLPPIYTRKQITQIADSESRRACPSRRDKPKLPKYLDFRWSRWVGSLWPLESQFTGRPRNRAYTLPVSPNIPSYIDANEYVLAVDKSFCSGVSGVRESTFQNWKFATRHWKSRELHCVFFRCGCHLPQ